MTTPAERPMTAARLHTHPDRRARADHHTAGDTPAAGDSTEEST